MEIKKLDWQNLDVFTNPITSEDTPKITERNIINIVSKINEIIDFINGQVNIK